MTGGPLGTLLATRAWVEQTIGKVKRLILIRITVRRDKTKTAMAGPRAIA
jgi:hypothetical protein